MRKVVGRVKKTVVRVVALDMIFLLLLIVAGAFSGVLSEIIYVSAYLVPLAVFPWLSRGNALMKLSPRMKRTDILLCLPLIAPTLGATVGLSALVSYLLSFAGMGGTEMLTGAFFELLILHVLLPAVLEEALFRYVHLSLIAPYSRKSAVLISALIFAVAHCNVAQIPYAFVAGIVFAVLDLACGSILPSVVLHLLNNLASVFWLWDVSAPVFRVPFIVAVAALSVLSLGLVVILRRRYAKETLFMFDKNDTISATREVWVFVAVCLALAVGALF